jgi:hypothetical protein
MIVGLLLLNTIGADTPLWQTDIFMLLFGAGVGMNMQTLVLAMQNSVAPQDMGVATSSATFFRQVGGTLGTAVFLSILFTGAGKYIPAAYRKAGTDPAFQQAIHNHPRDAQALHSGLSSSGGLNDTAFLHKIDSVLAHPFLSGFSQAMDLVFLVGACVLVIAFVLSLFLKEVPLRMQSAMQMRREAEAEAEAARTSAAAAGAPAASAAGAGPTAPAPDAAPAG